MRFIQELRHCDFFLADTCWNRYENGLLQPSKLFDNERKRLVAAIEQVWEWQDPSEQKRRREIWNPSREAIPHKRIWDKSEMVNYFMDKLGAVYPSIGTVMKPADVACDR